MNRRDFLKSGHWPTLLSAFLYFDVSFMVWVLIGALGSSIAQDLGLNDAEKGLIVAVPLLGGSMLRLVLGLLTDRIGAKRTGLWGLALTTVPLLLGWQWADSPGKLIVVGMMLGIAGASFAVALPLASRWYPPRYQGLALGIAGAGNSGTALATFFAPMLAAWVGWQGVFGLAVIPILLVLLLFAVMAKDSPTQPPPQPLRAYFQALLHADTWWFNGFYAVTFGGFVGLASFLSIYFHDQYGLSKVTAGRFATLCVIAGSFLRPVGGYLADRWGGQRLLVGVYLGIAAVMSLMALLPPLPAATVILFVGMGLLGMGNGAVFQLVPLRFPRQIGVVTGVVGAAGGLGGFFLPTILGSLKQATQSFAGGFLLFAVVGGMAAVAMMWKARQWTVKAAHRRPGNQPTPAAAATMSLPCESESRLAIDEPIPAGVPSRCV
ncbi:MAG: NarK/NasA family nitrate transporter [Gemmataceae bacterium]|nr:NarK/NasA family nitrate transporter [Gemmataceae bacterium]